MADALQVLGVFSLVVCGIVIYFLPAIVAHSRRHHNASAITVLDVFLGWTLVGWVLALVWAHTRRPGQEDPAPLSVATRVAVAAPPLVAMACLLVAFFIRESEKSAAVTATSAPIAHGESVSALRPGSVPKRTEKPLPRASYSDLQRELFIDGFSVEGGRAYVTVGPRFSELAPRKKAQAVEAAVGQIHGEIVSPILVYAYDTNDLIGSWVIGDGYHPNE